MFKCVSLVGSPVRAMSKMHFRAFLVLLVFILLAAPSLSNPGGPPGLQNGELTTEVGCSCHGGGLPSTEVLVQISGVPESYAPSSSYEFVISGDAADSSAAGFILTDYAKGEFTWSEDFAIDFVPEVNGTISHNNPSSEKSWTVNWTAPETDVGVIHFSLIVNAVNGEAADPGDKWNILSFTISAPGAVEPQEEEALATRTLSVGHYDTLFVQEVDPEEIEREHQKELADKYFENGNLYYWPTLGILILGAVVQREFYERRFGGGPPHLAKELAIPQAMKRGVLFLVLLYFSVYGFENWGQVEGILVGCLAAWAAYGLYRTWIQAVTPAKVSDLL